MVPLKKRRCSKGKKKKGGVRLLLERGGEKAGGLTPFVRE